MAVTACLTFELVVLKRGKSTLEEGALFPWLIDWMTPPTPFPPSWARWAALLGSLPRITGFHDSLQQAGGRQAANSTACSLGFTEATRQLAMDTFIPGPDCLMAQ